MASKNDEKTRAVLNRWWHMKRDAFTGPDPDRPVGVAQIKMVDSIGECEKWRRQVMVDINKDVTFIQNRALGEAKIR
jgi:pre-mRNA-splicing factor ISY1